MRASETLPPPKVLEEKREKGDILTRAIFLQEKAALEKRIRHDGQSESGTAVSVLQRTNNAVQAVAFPNYREPVRRFWCQ